MQLFQLGTCLRSRKELYKCARSEVDRLSSSTGLNAGLVVEEHGLGYCLYSRAGKDLDSVVIEEGEEIPLHATAVGKAMLAEIPRKETEQILDQHGTDLFTEKTITNREELIDTLETIKNHRVAFEENEFHDNVRAIGIAITGKNDRLIGGLFVAGDSESLTGKQLHQNNPGLLISAKNRLGNPAQPPTKE
ncbi:IclR family transcriptional regulator [Halohasta litchfieldiae]|jgi:DNA-binding IclR family transcriptional regulator|uniref:IclR family transcriptional regulator n=1 Tax=Halohasta litchfieldiae TaxID=1073996 RepID=UPI0013A5B87E|nr:IclR family transcriptional regulator C-terminal domain-containing protein [Halohasta litchfieldiae]